VRSPDAQVEDEELASVKIELGKPLPDAGTQAVRNAVVSQVEADPERYLSEYRRRFGNVFNADDAARLFPEYNENPAMYRAAVHPVAQWIRDELFRRALAADSPDRDRVVFTAGGNAARKSTAISFSGASENSTAAIRSCSVGEVRRRPGFHFSLL
jgi:hypothetical protein